MTTATATKPASKKAPAKAAEPGFEQLAKDLAIAETNAKKLTAESAQAKAARSQFAADTIKAGFREKIDPEHFRKTLKDAGVLKGTISKMEQVLVALNDKVLVVNDVKSLNGAYNVVRQARIIAAGGASPSVAASTSPTAAASAPAITNPQEALDFLVAFIKGSEDPFKVGGEWLTKATTQITDAIAETDEDGDEEK